VKNKSFLNTTVHTWEMYPIESYQQKRARREKQLLESMPKKGPETTLLKMLLYEALGDKAATVRMTPKEKQAIKDYVHERLQMYEADPKQTYHLQIQYLERLLENYTVEFKKEGPKKS
jgi:hypothetical protein